MLQQILDIILNLGKYILNGLSILSKEVYLLNAMNDLVSHTCTCTATTLAKMIETVVCVCEIISKLK